jgi:hypothetical protein
VRVGGVRDPDLSKMKVTEFQDAANQQAFQEHLMFISDEGRLAAFLEQRFGVDLLSWHKDEMPAK